MRGEQLREGRGLVPRPTWSERGLVCGAECRGEAVLIVTHPRLTRLMTGTRRCLQSSSLGKDSVSLPLLPCQLSFGGFKDCCFAFFFFENPFVNLSSLFVSV